MNMAQPIRRSLAAMKRKGGDRSHAKMVGKAVSIWSGEHHAWWRDEGVGYTDDKAQAWVLPFDAAYRTTKHCGREKKIVFVEVQHA